MTDEVSEQAENAILSAAEAYCLVEEARQQRERAEAAEAERDALRSAARAVLTASSTGALNIDEEAALARLGEVVGS